MRMENLLFVALGGVHPAQRDRLPGRGGPGPGVGSAGRQGLRRMKEKRLSSDAGTFIMDLSAKR